jgi:3-hydroxybutyryl-CoA dehydrogenase
VNASQVDAEMIQQRSNTTIAICGHGQMGSSAAVFFQRAGYRVIVWGRDPQRLQSSLTKLDHMHEFLDTNVGVSDIERLPIESTTELRMIDDSADYMLECISENLDAKTAFLKQFTSIVRRGAALMSCTSGLSITKMGMESGTASRLVGAHFWNPPHLMPLVEVVSGDQTDIGLADEVAELLRSIGKIAIQCRDVPGFIGNRLLHAIFREAAHLVQSGICSAEDVDTVARLTFALRMPAVGPCQNMDLVGLPLVADVQRYLLRDLSTRGEVMPIIQDKIASGQTGMRSGEGFYTWTESQKETLLAARDQQILKQLETLKSIGRL